MQERGSVINTNSKFDFVPWNSNIDYGIYRIFNAFPLNLHPIKNPHRISTGLWGFITVPMHISYPYPWESPYARQPWNSGSPWIRPGSLFSQIFHGILFRWTLWMYLPTLKFVASPVAEIIGGNGKICAVPGYAQALISPKFVMGFCSNRPCERTCQVWSLWLYQFLR